MDLILLFFLVNIAGYMIWKIDNAIKGFAIEHYTIVNFAITVLFFFPLYVGGYLDIEDGSNL